MKINVRNKSNIFFGLTEKEWKNFATMRIARIDAVYRPFFFGGGGDTWINQKDIKFTFK